MQSHEVEELQPHQCQMPHSAGYVHPIHYACSFLREICSWLITCMTAPVSNLADFVPPDTVLPFTPGAVSVTSSSRFLGTSTLMTCTKDQARQQKRQHIMCP